MAQNSTSAATASPYTWRRFLLRWLMIVAGLYLAYVATMYSLQRQLLFPGQFRRASHTVDADPAREIVWIEAEGTKCEVWLYMPDVGTVFQVIDTSIAKHPGVAPNTRIPLVIYTHGNGELIDDWTESLETYRRWGCAVALVEYPGYGRSSGAPSEAAIAAVMYAAYDQLTKNPDIDPQRVICHGRSMGGGAACALARQRPVAALILESTYTSIPAMAGRYGLPGFCCSDCFDNLAAVQTWTKPLLVLHGELDTVVPFAHGAALAAAAPQAKFVRWEQRGHNAAPPNISAAWDEVREFLIAGGLVTKN